jgi:EAL domain-containing protein (putative c-di-GMP-specific phosphodiesterase class I)
MGALREFLDARFATGPGLPLGLENRYQPIVGLRDGRVHALEVLVRVRHPIRGVVAPDDFVPAVEQAGLAAELAEAVTRAALRDFDASFLDATGLTLAINLPLNLLHAPDAITRMEASRRSAGLPRGRLSIELTETLPVDDLPRLNRTLLRWREAGYRISIDDLSPWLAQHQGLLSLPFQAVKLDRGLVEASMVEAGSATFLHDTVVAAHGFGLVVVAEGVSRPEIWAAMRAAGVDFGQGHLISPPLPSDHVAAWLAGWASQPALPAQT